jgi:hypothetical protein
MYRGNQWIKKFEPAPYFSLPRIQQSHAPISVFPENSYRAVRRRYPPCCAVMPPICNPPRPIASAPSRRPRHTGRPQRAGPWPRANRCIIRRWFKKMIEFSLNSGLSLCLNLDCLGLNLGLNLGYLGLNLTWNLGLNFEFRLLRFELQIVFSLFMF